jgi:chaperonin GroES
VPASALPEDPTGGDGPDPRLGITMLGDRVLVAEPAAGGERRSAQGILIPATAQVGKRLAWAEVTGVGPHVRAVQPGDTVLYNPEDRFEVEVHGRAYLILRERDLADSGTGLYL